MSFVLALQRGWNLENEISFEVKGSFERKYHYILNVK